MLSRVFNRNIKKSSDDNIKRIDIGPFFLKNVTFIKTTGVHTFRRE